MINSTPAPVHLSALATASSASPQSAVRGTFAQLMAQLSARNLKLLSPQPFSNSSGRNLVEQVLADTQAPAFNSGNRSA